MTHNVWRNHAAVFAAIERRARSRYQVTHSLAAKGAYQRAAKTVERTQLLFRARAEFAQTQRGLIYQMCERRGYACYVKLVCARCKNSV